MEVFNLETNFCDFQQPGQFHEPIFLTESIYQCTLLLEGEKPFACNFCDAKYSQNPQLQVHLRKHTGEKPYACHFCDMRFDRRYCLVRHEKTHKDEAPFFCSFCDVNFSQHASIVNHEMEHTGQKTFTCKFCSLKYTREKYLKKHEKTHEMKEVDGSHSELVDASSFSDDAATVFVPRNQPKETRKTDE